MPSGHRAWLLARGFGLVALSVAGPARVGRAAAPDWEARGYLPLSGHERTVTAVAFRPGSAVVATASRNPEIPGAIWDLRDGSRLHVLAAGSAASDVTFSADGRVLALAHEQSISLWNAETGERAGTIDEAFLFPQRIEFAPRGLHLAVGTGFGPVHVYDARTGRRALTFDTRPVQKSARRGFQYEVRDVDWGARGVALGVVAASSSPFAEGASSVRVWDVSSRRSAGAIGQKGLDVTRLAFSPDGRHVALAAGSHALFYDMKTGRAVRRLEGHEEAVTGLDFSPRGTLIATSSADGTAAVWGAATGRRAHVLEGHGNGVMDVEFSPDGRHVATAGEDATARVWLVPEDLREAPAEKDAK